MQNNNNAIKQALLDVLDAHPAFHNMSLPDVCRYLDQHKKLCNQINDRYCARLYAQNKIQYVQLSICPQLSALDANALQVLIYLGMYCAQNGWVSIKQADLARVLGMSHNTLRAAIRVLIKNGLIVEKKPACRHDPAIWQVNPDVLYSGKRNRLAIARRDFGPKSQWLKQEPELMTIQESRYTRASDGEKVYYMHLNVSPPGAAPVKEKEPSEAPSTSKSS